MNQFPLWKNLLVLGVVLVGAVVASPNLFAPDPAVQFSRSDGTAVSDSAVSAARDALMGAGIDPKSVGLEDGRGMVRFADLETQAAAIDVVRDALPGHVAALTLAPTTPGWLEAIGLKPMSLGLDLRGGVHFLYQVDLEAAISQYLNTYGTDVAAALRDERIGRRVNTTNRAVNIEITDQERIDEARAVLQNITEGIELAETTVNGSPGFRLTLTDAQIKERQDFAIQQNIVTLRNRVNELGVAEPIVQRQGLNRIVVQLPGVQDPSQAERILNATATLEFRLVDTENNAAQADARGRAPLGTILEYDKGGVPVLLKREIIVSGDQLTDARSGYAEGSPAVFVRLNGQGADRMLTTTQQNLNRPMAVLFIEQKPEIKVEDDGEETIVTRTERTVINQATIRGVFSSNFQITGLTPFEAQDLSLLLRAGSLATPIVKVEERTIGPSLGADNIAKGRLAVIVGLLAVAVFMILYYRLFGLVANMALAVNIILIVALLSVFQASLTLPGIAGIVLTVGMAVDANVLIFERIREEIRNGGTPQISIKAGYEKAFSTIADANITTVIAALVLFMFGTGPIKGFAITLSLGILTSMFTAIIGTRAVVNLIYGGRRVSALSIGGASHAPA